MISRLTSHFAGIGMQVHGQPPWEKIPMNGMLLINTLDLPASRKLMGLHRIKSKDFICTFCYQTFSSLLSEDCFIYESQSISLLTGSHYTTQLTTDFIMWEECCFIKYAYQWKDATPHECLLIEEHCGISWTTFTALPGWMPARDSLVDSMHTVFLSKIASSILFDVYQYHSLYLQILGEVKHIVQQILVVGGMLMQWSRTNEPYKKLEKFLASIWWLSLIGRVPSKVNLPCKLSMML